MKVVLLQDVKKIGKKGDVIEVADGYGRNVLIRKGLGVEGTKANLNTAAQRKESKVFKDKVAADEAVIMASQLKNVKVVIKVQTEKSSDPSPAKTSAKLWKNSTNSNWKRKTSVSKHRSKQPANTM